MICITYFVIFWMLMVQIYAVSITVRIVVSVLFWATNKPCLNVLHYLDIVIGSHGLYSFTTFSFFLTAWFYVTHPHMEVWFPSLHCADHCHPQWWFVFCLSEWMHMPYFSSYQIQRQACRFMCISSHFLFISLEYIFLCGVWVLTMGHSRHHYGNIKG